MSEIQLESAAAVAAPAASPARRDLDRALLRGLAWTGSVRWLAQALSWVSTLVVARLLSPTDYGLVGMATIYVGLVQLVNQFGMGAAIVQQRDLSDEQVARVGGFSILAGIACAGLSLAFSGAVAAFFGEPAVRPVVAALSLTFVTAGVQVVPRALLLRDLEYRRLAWVDGLQAVSLTLATLTLAVWGMGYWALVLGALVSEALATAAVLVARPHRAALPFPFRSISGAVTFGGHLVVGRLAWYAYTNADTAVVGKVLGKAALGAYGFGWSIASIPVDRVSALVAGVTPAIFSAVQNDPPALRRYLKSLTEGLALVAFPASAGLFLVADDFVRFALGPAWEAAIVPLRILALYAGVRSLATLLPQVVVATGGSRLHMRYSLLAAVLLPLAFLAGSRWGTAGVALAWVVGYPLVIVPTYLRASLRALEMRAGEYLGALWPAFSSTLVMAAAVWAARLAFPAAWGPGPRFLASAALGAAVYAAAVRYAHASRLRAFRDLLREVRRQESPPPATDSPAPPT